MTSNDYTWINKRPFLSKSLRDDLPLKEYSKGELIGIRHNVVMIEFSKDMRWKRKEKAKLRALEKELLQMIVGRSL